ncbi:MAG: T9SS type A sorting domain-containing protein, partial [Flavobacteriales bacterium]
THDVIYDAVSYDKLLGTGVNYFYDELKYNPSYPIYYYNPNLYSIHNISPDSVKMVSINPTPDYFAYQTTVNGTPFNYDSIYPVTTPYAYLFWDYNPITLQPYSLFPPPTVHYPSPGAEVENSLLITFPDTIPDYFHLRTQFLSFKNVLFYPVYSQEICLGDQFEVNGEVVVSSGLYLDSLTTTLGTDSLVGRKITVQPFLYSDTVSATVCATDGFEFFGANYNQTGFYNVVKGANCDSAHFLDLESILISNVITSDQNNILTYSAPNPGYSYQWLDELTGLAVSGATSPSFSPTNNSSYALEITFNGCSVTSNAILTNIGLEDLEDGIICTPNPFKNNINLSFGESPESGTIRFYDLNAKLVYEQDFEHQNEVLVTTSSLPKGIYIIEIKTAEALYQKKMVK